MNKEIKPLSAESRSKRIKSMQVILAQPRGFCAGVERAIDIVERALEKFGAPVYVRHEIVHNKHVVDGLKAKGARFVDELDQVPEGALPHLQPPGRPPGGGARAPRPGAAGAGRDLPAGLQGPCAEPPLCGARP